jgi:threonine dehydrogenase-like Zn-dependent dehydrogenase
MNGEYPVKPGLIVGHEPVASSRSSALVLGFREGQRVIAGAITPSGYSNACLAGCGAQDGAGTAHGWKAIGGWKFGNTIDGCERTRRGCRDRSGHGLQTPSCRNWLSSNSLPI